MGWKLGNYRRLLDEHATAQAVSGIGELVLVGEGVFL